MGKEFFVGCDEKYVFKLMPNSCQKCNTVEEYVLNIWNYAGSCALVHKSEIDMLNLGMHEYIGTKPDYAEPFISTFGHNFSGLAQGRVRTRHD